MKNLVKQIDFEYVIVWTIIVAEIIVAACLVWANAILLAL